MREAPIYTACGKQVLRDGRHFADLCGPAEASAVADLLNHSQVMFPDLDFTRVDEIVAALWPDARPAADTTPSTDRIPA
ncbi:hypothetical protein ACFOON_15230 [Novosphingobium piscinae]|uniref:Uncharacterized protein n=1 Tax=Novosphingobium piscinae TaxID=1507448 RepID=A0A7X1FXG9_9SPHN|nr:hypothetical protein [Novosphingobium piscinae]MBC2668748.1 hypothetical protein [Novosphingobium piscinae]